MSHARGTPPAAASSFGPAAASAAASPFGPAAASASASVSAPGVEPATAPDIDPEVVQAVVAEMRLVDDAFMRSALKGRADCLSLIAGLALGEEDLVVKRLHDQADLPSPQGHGVVLDFECETADGRRLDVEIQSASRSFGVRRARYNASMLDAWSLPAGAGYAELPDCAVIVICEADELRSGVLRETFRRRADETSRPLGDGSVIVFVSCAHADGTPLGLLAHDMLCANPADMHYGVLADSARAAKMGGANMGKAMDEFREKVYNQGIEQGIEQGIDSTMAALKREGVDADLLDRVAAQLRASAAKPAATA